MENSNNSITRQVMRQITEGEPGELFFISDFADLDNDKMVGKILSQCEKLNKLVRLSKGIYFKPKHTRFGILYPDTEKIVAAIAERDKADILPTGSMAMNMIGLSTQVPMNAVYITTGSSRVINIGKRRITLKRSVPKNFAFKGEIMRLLVHALKSIGQNNVTEQHMQIIRTLFYKYPEPETILHDLRLSPSWIKELLIPIIKPKIS